EVHPPELPPPSLGAVYTTPPLSRRAASLDARVARERAFPVRHVPSPGQPATYPLEARVVVVCGAGNNGGDGFVVARHLLARGADVSVFLAGSPERVFGDARINHDAYLDLGGQVTVVKELAELEAALGLADLVIDALFGTGLDREIKGVMADIIEAINRAPGRRLAL